MVIRPLPLNFSPQQHRQTEAHDDLQADGQHGITARQGEVMPVALAFVGEDLLVVFERRSTWAASVPMTE